jgi:hypothetical protein
MVKKGKDTDRSVAKEPPDSKRSEKKDKSRAPSERKEKTKEKGEKSGDEGKHKDKKEEKEKHKDKEKDKKEKDKDKKHKDKTPKLSSDATGLNESSGSLKAIGVSSRTSIDSKTGLPKKKRNLHADSLRYIGIPPEWDSEELRAAELISVRW